MQVQVGAGWSKLQVNAGRCRLKQVSAGLRVIAG